MPRFELKMIPNGGDIVLLTPGDDAGMRVAHVYPPLEQYPLGNDRYINDRPNVFLDVVDIMDGNDPAPNASDEDTDAGLADEGNSVSLRSLAQRAARAAADGSGNARRFKDGRDLWNKITSHALANVSQPDAEPIVDVRRTHNWKKNQPLRNHGADPGAWFVSGYYSRSNVRKDAFHAWRGLDQVFSAIAETADADAETVQEVEKLRVARDGNADYPTYADIAVLVGDSNMLVFHNDRSFAEWLRDQGKAQEFMTPDTPVDVCVAPDPTADADDPGYIAPRSQMPAAHLANVLAPRE
ncbi:MAG: hypothetical protein PUF97_05265 [Bifidobacteriaceae bacterium]|nr:hypothetical protein [Bifidobacteriaceae bacterium]